MINPIKKKTLWFLPWSTLNTTFQNMLPYLGSLNDFAAVFMDVTYAQTFISTDPSKSSTTTARRQPVIFLNHWEHAKKSLVIMITKSLWPSYMVLNLMYFENLVLKKWRRKMVVCILYINNKKNYPINNKKTTLSLPYQYMQNIYTHVIRGANRSNRFFLQ